MLLIFNILGQVTQSVSMILSKFNGNIKLLLPEKKNVPPFIKFLLLRGRF